MSHSVQDQLRFLNQWFRTWSEYQKDDFLHALASKLSPKGTIIAEVNGVVNGMQGLNTTSGRPPSLFACQIKLFNEWWDSWSEAERGKLTEELKKDDAKFWADLESEMDGTRNKDLEDFYTVEPSAEAAPVSTDKETNATAEISVTKATDSASIVVPTSEAITVISTADDNGLPEPQDQGTNVDNFKTTIEVKSLEPEEDMNGETEPELQA